MPTMNILSTVLTRQSFTSATARLVAIAFFACSTLFLTVAAGAWAFIDRPDVERYAEVAELYRMLAILATVLLVVPAVSLGVASAKLSARRQDERLSTLSLLGASKGTVRLVAVAEPFIPAAAGILAGIAGYFALAYPLSFIVFAGQPLGYSALIMPVWLLAAVVVWSVVVGIGAAAPLVSALALGLLALIARIGSALKGQLPPALLTPIPTPMGDLGAAMRMAWAVDAVLLTALAGAAAALAFASPLLLAGATVAIVAVGISRWRRRA